MAGAADRCLIPESAADVERLTELMVCEPNEGLRFEGRNLQPTTTLTK
jgi:hypothetical protein